jgi:hypothetical protein
MRAKILRKVSAGRKKLRPEVNIRLGESHCTEKTRAKGQSFTWRGVYDRGQGFVQRFLYAEGDIVRDIV